MSFYEFYKIQQKCFHYLRIQFCMQAPGKNSDPAIGSLGAESGDSGQIPVRGSPERVGEKRSRV
jgi:hypothetical protein